MSSKKETILDYIETLIKSIKKGDNVLTDYNFENTVGYIDRQYINVTPKDLKNKPMPWVLINNEGERVTKLVGRNFESLLYFQIVGFVQADKHNPKLDTLMNSLQKDIISVILKDEQMGGLCDETILRAIDTVDSMIYPYGAFVITFDSKYTINGLENY